MEDKKEGECKKTPTPGDFP
jgi:hypothetical protein